MRNPRQYLLWKDYHKLKCIYLRWSKHNELETSLCLSNIPKMIQQQCWYKLSFLGYTLIYCRNLGKNKWIPWRILYFSFFIKQFKGRVGDLRRERDLTFVSKAKWKVWSIKRVFATEGDLHVPLHKEKKT